MNESRLVYCISALTNAPETYIFVKREKVLLKLLR
jgi:hypothetical protein